MLVDEGEAFDVNPTTAWQGRCFWIVDGELVVDFEGKDGRRVAVKVRGKVLLRARS